ncbi:MAG: DUF4148 domain-containing protein [Burkholderiales bacterium]|nr:DUF4148 domain-containing protein [Burkholderiales bacterium]
MRIRTATITTLAVAATFALPSLAHADSMYHPANGEVGFTYHPEHFKSNKTRAEVVAEVEAARKDGTLRFYQLGLPIPVKNAGPGKTRQQVIDEMRSETPEQRKARMEMYTGG